MACVSQIARITAKKIYQSGYLTIKSYRNNVYILGFLNEEVRVSFIQGLAPYDTNSTATYNHSFIIKLICALDEGDIDKAMSSKLPYRLALFPAFGV